MPLVGSIGGCWGALPAFLPTRCAFAASAGSPAHLEQRCHVLVTAVGAVLERAVWDATLSPEHATREAKRLAEGYLGPLLEDLQ